MKRSTYEDIAKMVGIPSDCITCNAWLKGIDRKDILFDRIKRRLVFFGYYMLFCSNCELWDAIPANNHHQVIDYKRLEPKHKVRSYPYIVRN